MHVYSFQCPLRTTPGSGLFLAGSALLLLMHSGSVLRAPAGQGERWPAVRMAAAGEHRDMEIGVFAYGNGELQNHKGRPLPAGFLTSEECWRPVPALAAHGCYNFPGSGWRRLRDGGLPSWARFWAPRDPDHYTWLIPPGRAIGRGRHGDSFVGDLLVVRASAWFNTLDKIGPDARSPQPPCFLVGRR